MKKVVVLGGGIGGAFAAARLAKALAERADITLVDREGTHHFPPSYPWLVMGWRTPEQLTRPLSRLKAKGVRLRQEDVTAIDPNDRKVVTRSGKIDYDYLLVALGAQLDPAAIPGFSAAHHPYDLPGAVRLGQALREFRGGRIAIGISRLPFKCPAAPYETALLMDYSLRRRGLRDRTEIEFFTPEPHPVPAAGEAIGKQVERLMGQRGIPVRTRREIDHIDEGSKLVQFKGGAQARFDLLVAVPPHTTCPAVRNSDLVKGDPWIPVDRYTMRTGYDDVYAVGDVTKIPTPSGNVPALPKAGVFAERQARVAVENIAAGILGGEGVRWDGNGLCFLESGRGRAGMVRGDFFGEAGPGIRMRRPGRLWHWTKVLTEKRWLSMLFR